MKLPFRTFPILLSAILVAALYWGLNQMESRSIYASWDKWLHGSVFFLAWWLTRWSLRMPTFWLTLLVIALGGAEEIHQIWEPDHQADWSDWYADIAGVSLAVLIYGVGRLLWLVRASVEEREASVRNVGLAGRNRDGEPHGDAVDGAGDGGSGGQFKRSAALAVHPVDWHWALKLWRWEYYVVLQAGHNRRALSQREQELARWAMAILVILFLLVSAAIGLLVIFLIETALGVDLLPAFSPRLWAWVQHGLMR